MAAAIMQTSHSVMPENAGTRTVNSNATLITSNLVMTPILNHDLKGAVYTEEGHCSHTHSTPKVSNKGYLW
jgi:hypothetical protein